MALSSHVDERIDEKQRKYDQPADSDDGHRVLLGTRGILTPNVRAKRPPAVWRLGREADDNQHGLAAKAARRWRSA